MQKFYSPNILAVASSLVGEDSLSHHVDPAIGVYIIDRYEYYDSCYILVAIGVYIIDRYSCYSLLIVSTSLNEQLNYAVKIPI